MALQPLSRAQLSLFFTSLKLFGIGLSWRGYESLALPVEAPVRSVRPLPWDGPLIRVHAGLEDAGDLAADFVSALEAASRPGSSARPQRVAVKAQEAGACRRSRSRGRCFHRLAAGQIA